MELGGFQKTVLLVAIGILSLSLFGIGIPRYKYYIQGTYIIHVHAFYKK